MITLGLNVFSVSFGVCFVLEPEFIEVKHLRGKRVFTIKRGIKLYNQETKFKKKKNNQY